MIDLGGYKSVISKQLLEKASREIDQPSSIRIVFISGERKHPLEIVNEVPIKLNNKYE